MNSYADSGHNSAPVKAIALCVHLPVHVNMRNKPVKRIDEDQPEQEEEIGIAEPEDELGVAEEVHKAHVDHHPGRKPQAQ